MTGAWASLLVDWLDREGLALPDVRATLARFAPDDDVPIPLWRELLDRAAAARPGLRAPGLSIGALVEPRHVGVLGYLVLASATLGDALLAYRRYERLFYGAELAEVVRIGDAIELRWSAHATGLGLLGDAVSVAALFTFMRDQVDADATFAEVAFPHAAPRDAAAYRAFFGCRVRFGDTHVRLRIPGPFLALPMRHRDPHLRALLDEQARALLSAIPERDAFEVALSRAICAALPEGAPTVARLARGMHVSIRTLQRRLEARGLTWQALLDRTRTELALRYLADPSLSLPEVALLLGYSEQSAFTRAFRRATGATPSRVRRSSQAAGRPPR